MLPSLLSTESDPHGTELQDQEITLPTTLLRISSPWENF